MESKPMRSEMNDIHQVCTGHKQPKTPFSPILKNRILLAHAKYECIEEVNPTSATSIVELMYDVLKRELVDEIPTRTC